MTGGTRSLAWKHKDVDCNESKAGQTRRLADEFPDPPFYKDLGNWALKGRRLQSRFEHKDYLAPFKEDLKRQVEMWQLFCLAEGGRREPDGQVCCDAPIAGYDGSIRRTDRTLLHDCSGRHENG